MKRLLSAIIVCIVGLVCIAQTAEATTYYYWNNTKVTQGSLLVRYSPGSITNVGTIRAGSSTTRNVFGFKAVYGRHYNAYVQETGTQLFNFTRCSDDTWISFNSTNDSSRHVIVKVTNGSC